MARVGKGMCAALPVVAAAAPWEETRGIGRLVKGGDLLGRCGVE